MARFYLARYIGSGSPGDSYRPAGADDLDGWASIDLRPPGSVDGLALLRAPSPLPTSPNRVTITDDLDEQSLGVRQRLESRLGVNLPDRKFRRLVLSLLLEHGDDANPNRWNQLRPAGSRYEVWLGELIDTLPVAAGGATVSDNFNRADELLDASANWTELISGGNTTVTTNTVRSSSSGTVSVYRFETALGSVNHYAQLDITAATNITEFISPAVRVDASAATCYAAQNRDRAASGDSLIINKLVAGVQTILASSGFLGANALNTPRTDKLEVNGSSLTDTAAAETLNVTDTAITTGTRVGLFVRNISAATVIGDNFQGVDLPKFVTVGQSSETDSATTPARTKRYSVNQPSETDTAGAVGRTKAYTVTQPTETDTTNPVGRAKAKTVSQATETDTAEVVTPAIVVPVGQASETDTATSIGRTKRFDLTQPSETDTAGVIRLNRAYTLSQATETDTAAAAGAAKATTLGQASETDTATAVASAKRVTLGQAAETDAAGGTGLAVQIRWIDFDGRPTVTGLIEGTGSATSVLEGV